MEHILDEDRCSQVSQEQCRDRAGFDGKLSHFNTEVAISCQHSHAIQQAAITILGITIVSRFLFFLSVYSHYILVA